MCRPHDDPNRRYDYHPPRTPDTVTAHEQIRAGARTYADTIRRYVPPTPERERALDALDDVMFRANAGIARGPLPGPCRCSPRLRTKDRSSVEGDCPGPWLRDAARGTFGEATDG